MLRRVVTLAELLTVAGVVVLVVFLFANEPGRPAAAGSPGAQLFQANCARCHGAGGEGGIGPQLSGGAAVRDFPNETDQIDLVSNGRGAMPSFKGTLSPDQIRAVVDYTRAGLGH